MADRKDRTSELRKKGFEGRRLGPKQMTTDTAVRVTRKVVKDKGMMKQSPQMESKQINSSLGRDPIPRLSRAQVERAREYGNAVQICQESRWKTNHANSMSEAVRYVMQRY